MGVDDGLAYLKSEIDERINTFSKSKDFYRRGSLIQSISAASLAAITTLLIGLNQIYSKHWLAALSLASAGLTAIVTALGSWFGFRELWVSNQQTLNNFHELKSRIEYNKKMNGIIEQAKVDAYYESYQAILNKANRTWGEARADPMQH